MPSHMFLIYVFIPAICCYLFHLRKHDWQGKAGIVVYYQKSAVFLECNVNLAALFGIMINNVSQSSYLSQSLWRVNSNSFVK